MVFIYVLKCNNNKYYIGKTIKSVNRRFRKHKKGRGSSWTKKYRPIEIMKIYENCDNFDEDKYTKIYMNQYGIENVRGGSYTKINLDPKAIEFIEKELYSIKNKCYGCGSNKHFIKNCPQIYKNFDLLSSDSDISSDNSYYSFTSSSDENN